MKSPMSNVKSQMSNISGFTLIELLVVISIIAVLSTIGLISYQVLLQNSRDGKRQSDLRLIQSYLEQYHADQFAYPLAASACGNGVLVTGCSLKDPPGQKTYLNLVPSEQLPNPYPQYSYVAFNTSGVSPVSCQTGSKCSTYCIYAALENQSGLVTTDTCKNNNPQPCSDTNKDACYNFAVSPP